MRERLDSVRMKEMLDDAIKRLRLAYKDQLETRKCTILIENISDIPAPDNSRFLTNKISTTKKHADVVKKQTNINLLICKATKMDGNPCNAKAKDGCEFCGRHNRKC